MTRCYLIVGPESAGNRVLCATLIAGGCHGAASGSLALNPYLDRLPTGESPVAVLRSFPHGGEWPDLRWVIEQLRPKYDRVTVLVTVRHPVAIERSQVLGDHVDHATRARDNIASAYRRILGALSTALFRDVDWMLVPYESLADGADALLEFLDLEPLADGLVEVEGELVELGNRNAQHFRREATV